MSLMILAFAKRGVNIPALHETTRTPHSEADHGVRSWVFVLPCPSVYDAALTPIHQQHPEPLSITFPAVPILLASPSRPTSRERLYPKVITYIQYMPRLGYRSRQTTIEVLSFTLKVLSHLFRYQKPCHHAADRSTVFSQGRSEHALYTVCRQTTKADIRPYLSAGHSCFRSWSRRFFSIDNKRGSLRF